MLSSYKARCYKKQSKSLIYYKLLNQMQQLLVQE